jgi:hypothetical protein
VFTVKVFIVVTLINYKNFESEVFIINSNIYFEIRDEKS